MFATRTEQTTTTTGTGTLDLIPALTGRQNFVDTIGGGNSCYYTATTADESQWEEGVGQVISGTPDKLTRSQVLKSSNANALVNFPAGTKRVYIGLHSDTIRFGSVGQIPTETGSAATRTLAFAPALRNLRAGMVFQFLSNYAGSGGSQTLEINGTGAYALKTGDGLFNPDQYDLPSGGILTTVVFDGAKYLLVGSGRAAARSVLDTLFVGAIIFVPGTSALAGTIKCNGALLSRTTYSALWSYAQSSGNISTEATWLTGSNYARFSTGDLSTNFRIPEYRGEFPRCYDDGRGVDSGRAIGVRQDQAFLSHTHTLNLTDPQHKHIDGAAPINTNGRYGAVNTGLGGNTNQQSGTGTTGFYTSTESTGITGSNSATGGAETRPVNVALLACIKY